MYQSIKMAMSHKENVRLTSLMAFYSKIDEGKWQLMEYPLCDKVFLLLPRYRTIKETSHHFSFFVFPENELQSKLHRFAKKSKIKSFIIPTVLRRRV